MRSREGGTAQPSALVRASDMIHAAEEVSPYSAETMEALALLTHRTVALPSFTSFVPAHWYACEIASIAATATTAARQRMGIFHLSSHRFTYYLPRHYLRDNHAKE